MKSQSMTKLLALRPDLAKRAQAVYDSWDASGEDGDFEVGFGGVCHLIADELVGLLNEQDGFAATSVSSHIGEQHVWAVVRTPDGVFSVDIHPSNYETGGGYDWQKIPDVEFTPDMIELDLLSPDPADMKDFVEDWEDDEVEVSASAGFVIKRWVDHGKAGDEPLHRIDAYLGDRLAGFLTHHEGSDGDYRWLKGMYVEPEFRSQNLGGLLLRTFIDDHPGRELRLRARPFRDKAMPVNALKSFYSKYGFKPMDDEDRMVRMPSLSEQELAASLGETGVSAMAFKKPYDGWKDLKPGKLKEPIELEGSEALWAKIADRVGHKIEHGLEMRAPVIGGRRRYHHRPLRSYVLSNDRTITITTDEMEARTWNNLKNKRHPAMPRIYDTFSIRRKDESEPQLWAVVHERLNWPVPEDWDLFVDTFFRWRAMEHDALRPAKVTDLEAFLRFIIDPVKADPKTTKRNRGDEVMGDDFGQQHKEDIARRRQGVYGMKDLEEKIKWAKSALNYFKQNHVKFRDFDPSNLAVTQHGHRVVITNLAESRSAPKRTGHKGRVKGFVVEAREGDQGFIDKANGLYDELQRALRAKGVREHIEVTEGRGIRLPLSKITSNELLSKLTLVVHRGPKSYFDDKDMSIVISAKPWDFTEDANPVSSFMKVALGEGYRRVLTHELVHFLDSGRFAYEKAKESYKGPKQDFEWYSKHPLETNAYFHESIARKASEYKNAISKLEPDTGPNNEGSNDHQAAVMRLDSYASQSMESYVDQWQSGFDGYVWGALDEKTRQKLKARAYQFFARMKEDATKRLQALKDRGDPMALL